MHLLWSKHEINLMHLLWSKHEINLMHLLLLFPTGTAEGASTR
jgi:hypothetical protein